MFGARLVIVKLTECRVINIAKFLAVVILCSAASACHEGTRELKVDDQSSPFAEPRVLGDLPAEVHESSGLAASWCQAGVLWTHNDSGNEAAIFAIDLQGKLLGVWTVDGAENKDWEDMSVQRDESGKCSIYVGDIGNTNGRGRSSHRIYRFDEPTVALDGSNPVTAGTKSTSRSEVLEFRYPDGRYDAETLLVHPGGGQIYVLTKEKSKPSAVYRLNPEFNTNQEQVVVRIGEFSVPMIPNGFLTGGAVSPDGRNVVIADYAGGYEISLPTGEANFDEIWKQKPRPFSLGRREQGEAIAISADGNSVYATSEGKGAKLIEVKRR
jgi:DNA-binding beta-propeller fold protein YncE